jgi:putative DNA primase/helicase
MTPSEKVQGLMSRGTITPYPHPTTEAEPRNAPAALALCPWAPPPKPVPARPSVIAEFNAAHDIVAIIEAHGYERRGEKRFAAPGSSHAAGIVLLDSGKLFCHHAGDPLSDEHALDAFDCYRKLQHNGDYRAAVRAAAQVLGMVSA